MAKLLNTVAAVRARLTLNSGVDVNAAIESALLAATSVLKTRVRTGELDQVARTDVFYVIRPWEDTGPTGATRQHVRLTLSAGFVTGGITSIKTATSYAGLATATALTAAELPRILDANKGFVTLESGMGDTYVEVVYTAGFTDDAGSPALYTPGEVPDWLEEAAMLQAIVLLEGNSLFELQDRSLEVKEAAMALNDLVNDHIRYRPSGYDPIESS